MGGSRRRRLVGWIAGGLAVATGVVAPSTGQEPANAPPPAASPPATTFSLPDDRIGTRVAPILLLSRDDVRGDLKLNESLHIQAQQAIGELYEQAAALRGKTGPDIVAKRRQVDQDCQGWLKQYLTEPQQVRLDQIDLQWEGPAALVTRPTLSAALDLSAAQAQQLAQAVRQRDQSRGAGGGILETERQLAEQTLEILKPSQRERWKSMLGDVFQPKIAAEDGQVRQAGSAPGR